jgi:hypothetical protein
LKLSAVAEAVAATSLTLQPAAEAAVIQSRPIWLAYPAILITRSEQAALPVTKMVVLPGLAIPRAWPPRSARVVVALPMMKVREVQEAPAASAPPIPALMAALVAPGG